MIILLMALLIGVVAGLRTFTAPAAVSWSAYIGWLSLGDGPLAFLGFAWTPWIFTLLALVEFVIDQLPSAPSRIKLKAVLPSGCTPQSSPSR